MVRPVIPHIAGIVVGYWRNGCSYRNIAREVGLHSLSMASSKDSVNVEILFVEGVLDDHVKLMTGMTACCIALPIQCAEAETCMAAKREFCSFPPNGE